MPNPHFTPPPLEDILNFIAENDAPVTKREIVSAFYLKGQEPRRWLKQALKELCAEGHVVRVRGKAYKLPARLPAVSVVEVIDLSPEGELIAKPVDFNGVGGPPRIYVITKAKQQIEIGERALVRLKRLQGTDYEGRIIHVLGKQDTGTVVGVFATSADGGGYLYPADRKAKYDFYIKPEDTLKAEDGFLVVGEVGSESAPFDKNKKTARIVEVLGHEDDPKMISMIAIVAHGIPHVFPDEVLDQAAKGEVPDLGKRQDLRQIPLVTIDGADARDFDDAVFAEPDDDPKNTGGWHLIVAIADVSFYVTPGSPLDKEAYQRGNSTYFPDRVVPMLPEALSNDICSLRPDEPRACLAAHMWIDDQGRLLRYKFVRGLMKSHARLIYEQVQAAHDEYINEGHTQDIPETLMPHIQNLYAAYDVLHAARKERGALDLDLPERKAVINDKGEIEAILPRQRLDSHMLIEELMILANVAAAKALEDKNTVCMYRIHDKPNAEKIDAASDFLSTLGIKLDKGQKITPKRMNAILHKTKDSEESELVSMMVLRSQSQAVYSIENIGHFGLALEKYAHFTSPIRRYADLVVHRALVEGYKLPGGGGLKDQDEEQLLQTADHISETERRSMMAERDSMDRYTALFLSGRVGNDFAGRISGVTTAGLFIRLDETGADGFIPMRMLSGDYYIFDEGRQALIGRRTKQSYRLSAPVTVTLKEIDTLLGRMIFELVHYGGAPLPEKSKRQNPYRKKAGGKSFKKPKKKSGKKTTPKHKRKSK